MNLETRTRATPKAPPTPANPDAPTTAPANAPSNAPAPAPAPQTSPAPTDPGPQTLGGKANYFWREYLRPFIILAAVLFAFRSSVVDWNDVPTGSMKPTVLEGDRIFVNKLAYDLKVPFTTIRIFSWDKPARGEIVVFYQPKTGTRMVKRVVGIPGDKIEVRNNRLTINDTPLTYGPEDPSMGAALPPSEANFHLFLTEQLDGHNHSMMVYNGEPSPNARYFGPFTVPAGHYFMMGDNRDNSSDSRYWGVVPEDQILGRSSRIVLSLNRDSWYLPRFSRFFKGMP